MKKIEDYLHLYLGCEVLVTDIDGQTFTDKIESVINDKRGNRFSIHEFGDCPFNDHNGYYIQPILRPLSDMTEREAIDLLSIKYGKPEYSFNPIYERHSSLCIDFKFEYEAGVFSHTQLDWDMLCAESFRYLISKYFDLFGLIDAGLAIDKTKTCK